MCYAFIYNKETRPNMGRTSTKENKNSYQLAREELGLTREKASELLETIAPERIEKIENERTVPRPVWHAHRPFSCQRADWSE